MATILFSDVVFGPVKSRRLGNSLGMNLLPVDGKLCSFDCIYCECGLNAGNRGKASLPSREQVYEFLKEKLIHLQEAGKTLDSITFAGNGEPTMHPDFDKIIDDTIVLRDRYFPDTRISVLSNATMLHRENVFNALNKVDNNILKLDSVLNEKIQLIDQPNIPSYNVEALIKQLKLFNGNLIIQTMFLRGIYRNCVVDNTGEEDVAALIKVLQEVCPKQVMIYTLARNTPVDTLKKIPLEELNRIADKMRASGLIILVSE